MLTRNYKQISLFHIHTKLTRTIRQIQTALWLSLGTNFKVLNYEINLRTLKSLDTALNCQGQIELNCKQLTIGSSQCSC